VISEHHGRIRPGEHLRQVDDPDIAERARGIYLHQWLPGLIERTTREAGSVRKAAAPPAQHPFLLRSLTDFSPHL
jgi:hypothetical protein